MKLFRIIQNFTILSILFTFSHAFAYNIRFACKTDLHLKADSNIITIYLKPLNGPYSSNTLGYQYFNEFCKIKQEYNVDFLYHVTCTETDFNLAFKTYDNVIKKGIFNNCVDLNPEFKKHARKLTKKRNQAKDIDELKDQVTTLTKKLVELICAPKDSTNQAYLLELQTQKKRIEELEKTIEDLKKQLADHISNS